MTFPTLDLSAWSISIKMRRDFITETYTEGQIKRINKINLNIEESKAMPYMLDNSLLSTIWLDTRTVPLSCKHIIRVQTSPVA